MDDPMDEPVRRAEELLEQRMRSRHRNGDASAAGQPEPAPTEASAEGDVETLTKDLQRLAADFANYRKRNESDRTDFAKFAKADLISKLLDVVDGYDRAVQAVPRDLEAQPWVEGMRLVERKFRAILQAEGVEPVDAVGTRFDPYLHDAVAQVESDEPEGTVIEEFQKAYRLHDRVIRPALVSVAKSRVSSEPNQGE